MSKITLDSKLNGSLSEKDSAEVHPAVLRSHELAVAFAKRYITPSHLKDYFTDALKYGLFLLVGNADSIRRISEPKDGTQNGSSLPFDYVLENLGYGKYPDLSIYEEQRMQHFLDRIDDRNVHSGLKISDGAIGIDPEGYVLGARLHVDRYKIPDEPYQTIPETFARHIAASQASLVDNLYSIVVSQEKGAVTTFRNGLIVPNMCCNPLEHVEYEDSGSRKRSMYSIKLPTHFQGQVVSPEEGEELLRDLLA